MLIIEAKKKALMIGICSDSAKVQYKTQKFVHNHKVVNVITEYLNGVLPDFKINKVALTLAPTDIEMTKKVLDYLKSFNCKIRPVHHLDAHLSYMREPFLGLIATSTNTELILYNQKSYEILGIDIDMPLGIAFYKLSKELNYSLNLFNTSGNTEIIPYPLPMHSQKGLDFSFAGCYYYTLQHIYPKVLNLPKNSDLLDPSYLKTNKEGVNILFNSFQEAVCEQIEERVRKAIIWTQVHYPHIKVFAFSGGVSQNKRIKDRVLKVCSEFGWKLRCKNEQDSIEMIRDLVFFKKSALYSPHTLSPTSNYPLGPYKFVSISPTISLSNS